MTDDSSGDGKAATTTADAAPALLHPRLELRSGHPAPLSRPRAHASRNRFLVNQNEAGSQRFRSPLPIGYQGGYGKPASDGQLGGIMKMYREWRISGDAEWLKTMWPSVRQSLEFCIKEWDPERQGILTEAHHNTYDIDFHGTDSMVESFYLGALAAAIVMAEAVGDDAEEYKTLLQNGRKWTDENIFNGEYYYRIVRKKDRQQTAKREMDNQKARRAAGREGDNIARVVRHEGPMNQYYTGCLADCVVRNPFNEYECGHWHARAMPSYSLIQALTGVRYDAVGKTLYIDSRVGNDFHSFLSTATGFGTVGLKNGKLFIEMKMGELDVERVSIDGEETSLGRVFKAQTE